MRENGSLAAECGISDDKCRSADGSGWLTIHAPRSRRVDMWLIRVYDHVSRLSVRTRVPWAQASPSGATMVAQWLSGSVHLLCHCICIVFIYAAQGRLPVEWLEMHRLCDGPTVGDWGGGRPVFRVPSSICTWWDGPQLGAAILGDVACRWTTTDEYRH